MLAIVLLLLLLLVVVKTNKAYSYKWPIPIRGVVMVVVEVVYVTDKHRTLVVIDGNRFQWPGVGSSIVMLVACSIQIDQC